jgi:hypothetical protein
MDADAAGRVWDEVINLTGQVQQEMRRVWAGVDFDGEDEQYTWLQTHYGVTEEEDVRWQYVSDFVKNGSESALGMSDADDKELLAFLYDRQAVRAFLEELLRKYRSNTVSYPGGGDTAL